MKKIRAIIFVALLLGSIFLSPVSGDEGDYIDSWALDTENTFPRAIATDGINIWVVDSADDAVYNYSMTGTYISNWTLTALNDDANGMTTNGTNIWVCDFVTNDVYKYNMIGEFIDSWSLTGANTNPTGMATNGTNIWVCDSGTQKVYKYNMTGGYIDSWELNVANTIPYGATTNGTNIWVCDWLGAVYKYNMIGGYIDSWALTGANSEPKSITTYGINIWVLDLSDKVYKYEGPPNNPPTQSGESPTNGSVGIGLTPALYVICNDTDDGDTLTATWRSNSTWASDQETYPLKAYIKEHNETYTLMWAEGMCKLDNGKILGLVSRGTHGSNELTDICIHNSTDNGTTWGDLTLIKEHDATYGYIPKGIFIAPNGNLIFHYLEWEDRWHSYVCQMHSDDDGATWTDDGRVAGTTTYYGHIGNAIILSDGYTIVVALSESVSTSYDNSEVIISTNNGTSWTRSSQVPRPGGENSVYEPTVVELSNGNLVMYCRSPGNGYLWKTYSTNKGSTWSEAVNSGIIAPSAPAGLLRYSWTPSIILMAWDNDTTNRYPLKVAVSYDECETWQNESLLQNGSLGDAAYPRFMFGTTTDDNLIFVNAWINDPAYADTMGYRFPFYWLNESDPFTWITFATNTSISPGTNITQMNSNFSARNTTYYWRVDLTDGTDWTNDTYHFATTDNNPPTIESFNIDTEPGANAGWDFDNNDAQMDWATTDDDADPVTVYITFNKGSEARLPTTGDYDYHVQDDDAIDRDCNWEFGAWSDYDGAVHVKIRAYDGTEYSASTLTDTLANGIDGTNPTGTIDEYGIENLISIEGDSTDATSGVASNDITIHDTTDGDYWTGSEWGSETWLDCTGTTTWSYDSSGVSWDIYHEVTITLRIYDVAGNVDSSADTEDFTTNEAPELTSPSCDPDLGIESDTVFTFNVTYSDTDGYAPVDICVNISLGTWYTNNSMVYVSGDNMTGAIYTNSTTFPTNGEYSYVFHAYDGYIWNSTSPETFTVFTNASFQINFPIFLEVGQYIHADGTLINTSGDPISGIWATTKILDSGTWDIVTGSELRGYIVDGYYCYTFSTSTMIPAIYYINVNFTYFGIDFFTNHTLYLSIPGGPGHTITNVYFTFYNDNTGVGIEPLSFKVYASDSTPLGSGDRIYGNEYPNTYTGATLYYRIDDYFDNQIYPASGSYESLEIISTDQFEDVPITWYDLSIKNLNQTIMHFSMENSSRYYNATLFPMDSVHINVLSGSYDVTLKFYSAINGSLLETVTDTISISEDTFYIATGYNAMVHVSWYNTNEGLGLPDETLKLYFDDQRHISRTYWTYINQTIKITIKDYYNFTLFEGNFTITSPYRFLDFGLTFHEYDFTNANDEYFYASFLKEGATRWYEKVVSSGGQKNFMLPSGNYTIRVYNADNSTYLSWDDTVNRSKAYLIGVGGVSLIIQGQSVIIGEFLELREELAYAFMPDVTIISRNPPMIFSVYDKEGMAFGNEFYMICPPLITIATTRVTQYGNWINSTPTIPGNGSVLNGTITIIRDVLHLSGPGSISWVNITNADNGTLFQNTSYIPSRVDIYGENLTINASGDISVMRETKYNQVRKFDWTYYPFSGYGPDLSRAGWHTAGIEIINVLDVPLYEVYAIAGFSNESNPDANTVEIRDTTNGGVILERGPNYDVTDTSVHFNLLSLVANETRAFTIGYYKMQQESYIYDEGTVSVPTYEQVTWNGGSYNSFPVHWNNPHSETFRGALYIKLNFLIPTEIDTVSMRIYDLTNDHELDSSAFIPGSTYIRISADAIGDVLPGGSRKFDVYFLMTEYPGADPRELHLDTELYLGITPFLIILLLGVGFIILGAYFAASDRKTTKDRWKMSVGLGIFLVVVIYIMKMMGL